MKKCLTVLLVIAVMFTFSFGSAFAAAPTDDQKVEISNAAAKYDAEFEKAAETYITTLTFNKDEKLIGTKTGGTAVDDSGDAQGVLEEAVVTAYINDKVKDAEKAFDGAVADLYEDDSQTWTSDLIAQKVTEAYNDAMDGILADATLFGAAEDDLLAMLEDQIKASKDAAIASLAPYTNTKDVYSANPDDWSITISDSDDIGGTYNSHEITGKDAGKVLSAKEFVDAVVETQTAVVNGSSAAAVVATDAATIKAIDAAVKTVKDVVDGHKKTDSENYYIEAVPTITDLESDTTVAEAKDAAIAQLKAALASKEIELSNELKDAIDTLDQYASLNSTQKALLEKLQDQRADLAAQFDAAEECWVALINYQDTVGQVNSTKTTLIDAIAAFDTDANGLTSATLSSLEKVVQVSDWVADLKDEAALLEQQKDVNGNPYYDPDVLAENLEKAIEYLYTDGSATYDKAVDMLADGTEAALIAYKIEYIKFISGKATTLEPKDSNGKKVTTEWNKADAANTITSAVPVFTGYNLNVKAMYDKAQKAELEALVSETKAAIEKAATLAEIEAIFAEANDAYEAIPTTNDHFKDWASTGKIGLAYANAKYDKELLAYATYFSEKVDTDDYLSYVDTPADILKNVAYPIVYGAYTADELAAKVTEAKAAIDAIMTSEEIEEAKDAVEDAIKALPAKIALSDKAAIVAAADALADYKDIPGVADTAVNEAVLESAIKAYEKLAGEELDDAFKALDDKKITTDDEAAVEALRALYDAYDAFCEDYYDDLDGNPARTATTNDNAATDANSVKKIEGELSDAKVAAVREMMIQLPVNPTAAQRDEVLAARAAYEALSLEEKARIVGSLAYDNLIDAEEYLGISSDDFVKAYLQDLSIVARSVKTASGNIKVTINADVQPILDAGYTVEYKFYRSTKPRSNYGTARMIKTENVYTNTTGTKGVRYYYKAMIQRRPKSNWY